MRIWIDKGYLIQGQEIEGPGGPYNIPLEFQVFDETGAPSQMSYRGEGTLHPDGRIIIGDPYRDVRLLEGTVTRQATSESWNYYRGFKQAIEDRREEKQDRPKKYYAQPSRWWEGYRDGWREKREATKKRKNNQDDVEREYAHLMPAIDKAIDEGGGWANMKRLPGGQRVIWELIDAGVLEEKDEYVRRKKKTNPDFRKLMVSGK